MILAQEYSQWKCSRIQCGPFRSKALRSGFPLQSVGLDCVGVNHPPGLALSLWSTRPRAYNVNPRRHSLRLTLDCLRAVRGTPDTTSSGNRGDADVHSVAIETKTVRSRCVVGGRLLAVGWRVVRLANHRGPGAMSLDTGPKKSRPTTNCRAYRLLPARPAPPAKPTQTRLPANLNPTQTNSVSIQTHPSVTERSQARHTPPCPDTLYWRHH